MPHYLPIPWVPRYLVNFFFFSSLKPSTSIGPFPTFGSSRIRKIHPNMTTNSYSYHHHNAWPSSTLCHRALWPKDPTVSHRHRGFRWSPFRRIPNAGPPNQGGKPSLGSGTPTWFPSPSRSVSPVAPCRGSPSAGNLSPSQRKPWSKCFVGWRRGSSVRRIAGVSRRERRGTWDLELLASRVVCSVWGKMGNKNVPLRLFFRVIFVLFSARRWKLRSVYVVVKGSD